MMLPKQPKIDVGDSTLMALLHQLQSGELQVPRFQRDFVWSVKKTRDLLDSMYKEFPIGTFFLWRAPTDLPYLCRPLDELDLPAPKPNSPTSYILDGQQRLISLYVTIVGLKYRSRDYGRICLDLDAATRFDRNHEEDQQEDIFVYRTPDNERYVRVCDLVHDTRHLEIYDKLQDMRKAAFIKGRQIFMAYPFSVVWIQEQELADAIVIFQRINQGGKRLSRYDLVCANIWAEDFDFRKKVADLNERFSKGGFGRLDENVYTQTFSLAISDRCTTAAELAMDTKAIRNIWDRVVQAIELAIDFVSTNFGVKRFEFLPYRGLLVVIAYYFFHRSSSALSAEERQAIWSWFWQVALSERYGSTSPSRMAEDALKLRQLLDGKHVVFNYPSLVTPESVASTKMSSTSSALRNAFICMLALRKPLNLKDGSEVNLASPFFSDLKHAERHHVFPVAYLATKREANAVHLVPNFLFIPADLNKEIRCQPPARYLASFRAANPGFRMAAESHLLPVDDNSPVWRNDYDEFLLVRAEMIAKELNSLAGAEELWKQPVLLSEKDIPTLVTSVERRLRDFIDHRLSIGMGPNYWVRAMPGDVITEVKSKIATHLGHNPAEKESNFQSGRARLDFCDLSQYERIIMKNWEAFSGYFLSKARLSDHMRAYCDLRNAIAHSRKPNQVELMNGSAALLWLQGILDRYDRETGESDEIPE